ncbi:hypothetical protein BHU24_25290 [Bacillus pseudomycoides]|nr:hypothetical protein [Bacillus pseudomycoides]PEO92573.1 hypothetical protein CN571_01950 [Bacillus pseudomycoides]
MKYAFGYILLLINTLLVTPILNRMLTNQISQWDAISYICPLITILALMLLLGKNKPRNIYWKINLKGHIIVGLIPILFMLSIFIRF